MICGYVVSVGEGLLADVAVGCCGFEVCPYLSVSCIVVEGAPLFSSVLSDTFTFSDDSLMCVTVACACC